MKRKLWCQESRGRKSDTSGSSNKSRSSNAQNIKERDSQDKELTSITGPVIHRENR